MHSRPSACIDNLRGKKAHCTFSKTVVENIIWPLQQVPVYTHPSFPTPDDMNFTGGKGFPVFTQNLKIQSVKKKNKNKNCNSQW